MYDPIDYAKLIAVTDRRLCDGSFLHQIRKICLLRPAGIILREKDLPEKEYAELAAAVLEISEEHNVPCFLHSHTETAEAFGCDGVHFSLQDLRTHPEAAKPFRRVSVSCHSAADLAEAQRLGATQALLGNIYETECKKGLPGRGLAFLKEGCATVTIPVYAIGGVTPERLPEVLQAGAAGGAMMSGFMRL